MSGTKMVLRNCENKKYKRKTGEKAHKINGFKKCYCIYETSRESWRGWIRLCSTFGCKGLMAERTETALLKLNESRGYLSNHLTGSEV